jgi:ABC-type multidrug transport system permease subunit
MKNKNITLVKKKKLSRLRQWFYDLRTILYKDIISTKRVKKYFFGAIIPPIIILIVFSTLFSISPEIYRVMVVDEDNTEYSNIMINYIENIHSEFGPWFDVVKVDTYEEARERLENFDVLGLIYIPNGFQTNITMNNPNVKGIIYLEVQNINNDYVKNYMQRLDEAILTFNQELHISYGHVDDFAITAEINNVIDQSVSLLKGFVVGMVGLYGLICGLFFGSLNVAKEYEDFTIIEISNSPIKRTAYIASKQIIAVILGTIVVGIISIILFLIFNIEFRGNLGFVITAFILSTWIHACIGGLIGLLVKNKMQVILIAIICSIFLWFFTGGFVPIKVLGDQIYAISRIFPGTYWVEILYSETYYPTAYYSLSRLGFLGVITVGLTLLLWYLISKVGFKI